MLDCTSLGWATSGGGGLPGGVDVFPGGVGDFKMASVGNFCGQFLGVGITPIVLCCQGDNYGHCQ